ncbi:hypothetical protein UFOVP5_36 [uncultured Caudovirales phage]|uniref:Uncharacterized protein n=1 Tax=uncultured Caudovirales phage TaxID=2100421 RepID=A0A6J5KKR9_9CAUD|nr:hypothetical protein UFOVP5_36 [uncultured Caudovirales phage]
MSDLLQRARDIAADQYIRLSMKDPTPDHSFEKWSAHVECYSGFLRKGAYDQDLAVQTTLAALRSVAA